MNPDPKILKEKKHTKIRIFFFIYSRLKLISSFINYLYINPKKREQYLFQFKKKLMY